MALAALTWSADASDPSPPAQHKRALLLSCLTVFNRLLDDKVDGLDEDEGESNCQAADALVLRNQPACHRCSADAQ